MRKLTQGLLLGLLLLAGLSVAQAQGEPTATATLKDASGNTVGTITLRQGPNDVHITGSLTGLTPGVHGIHVHASGSCVAPDFNSAGSHFNPDGRKHGPESPEGSHAGDLSNLVVGENGMGSYDHTTTRLSLRGGPTSVFDSDGSAIVIHAGPDDYKTDPTGNSGARVACGVIVGTQQAGPTSIPLPDTGVADQPVSLPNTAEPSNGAPTWVPLLALALLGGALALRLRSRH